MASRHGRLWRPDGNVYAVNAAAGASLWKMKAEASTTGHVLLAFSVDGN